MKNDTIKLKCNCGKDFERPAQYKEWIQMMPNSVHWKWKLQYCDGCFTDRVNKALERLPDIIKALANDTK